MTHELRFANKKSWQTTRTTNNVLAHILCLIYFLHYININGRGKLLIFISGNHIKTFARRLSQSSFNTLAWNFMRWSNIKLLEVTLNGRVYLTICKQFAWIYILSGISPLPFYFGACVVAQLLSYISRVGVNVLFSRKYTYPSELSRSVPCQKVLSFALKHTYYS